MNFLAVIPARGGSKGIPRKNIRLLNSKPLIWYSIQAALGSKYIKHLVVSTEDKEIAQIVDDLQVEVVNRPSELAKDETMTAPVILNTVEQLEKKGLYFDAVIILQATCPLRNSQKLDKTIKIFINNPNCDSIFTAKKIGLTHTKWKYSQKGNLEALYDYRNRPRRQDMDKHYDLLQETGETYIIKTDALKEICDVIGKNPIVDVVADSIDIDTEEDFKKVEEILKWNEKY